VRGTPFLKEGFTGGLNTIDSPYTVAENESRDCLNVVSTERGSIRKRYGSVQFLEGAGIPATELTSCFACVIAGTQYLLVSNGKELWSVTTAGAVAKIGEGFTANSLWCMVQAPESKAVAAEGPVYMVNGVDKPQYWTGATAATKVKEWTGVASAPKLTDGVMAEGGRIKSKTAGFLPSDVGLVLKLESTVEVYRSESVYNETTKVVEVAKIKTVIKEPLIETVINSEEAVIVIPVESTLEKEYTAVHFSIERAFYKEGGHVPNGQYMVFFGNRIWMTGIKADPSAVWFSELVSIGEGGAQADPSQWPNLNVVRFDASDGNEITGIGSVGPYLCLFKEFKTWIIHDINTGANRRLADNVGCVAHRSIVETTGGTFFLTSDQGVYLTEGSKLHEMSYNIRPTVLAVNPEKRTLAAGAYFNNHYYLSFASGASTTANRTVDYDVQLKSWWLHDLTGSQWTIWEPTAGKPELYCLPPEVSAGVVQAYAEGVYTDRGNVYPGNGTLSAYFLSAWEPFAYYVFRHRIKAPFLKKRVRQLFFNGEGQIVPLVYRDFLEGGRQEGAVVGNDEQADLELPTNFGAGDEKWAEGTGEWAKESSGAEVTWGGEATVGAARIYSPGVGFVWSFGFGNNSAEPFIVDAAVWMVQFRKS